MRKKFFLRGWMFTDIEIFFLSLDIPHKISFITFLLALFPLLRKTRSNEKIFPKNFVSFLASSYALCSKVCDKSISFFHEKETGRYETFPSTFAEIFIPLSSTLCNFSFCSHMFWACLKFAKVLMKRCDTQSRISMTLNWVLRKKIWERRRERKINFPGYLSSYITHRSQK